MAVSIGMPFYNAEPYIADAIRSVLAQSYEDWELILVNDGSTDRSLEIALSVNDPRIRVVTDGQNRRLPYRLNQITRLANYDHIARMDADDLMSPRRLQEQIRILAERPDIDLVATGLCSISTGNIPIGFRIASEARPISGKNILLNRCEIVHSSVLGRKSWFERNRYDHSMRYTEDYELWLRAYSNRDLKIHILPEPLYYYREEGNVSREKLLQTYESQRALFGRYASLAASAYGREYLTLRSHCKSMIVRSLAMFDLLHLLLRRRNSAITDPQQLSHFNQEISTVLATPLPVKQVEAYMTPSFFAAERSA